MVLNCRFIVAFFNCKIFIKMATSNLNYCCRTLDNIINFSDGSQGWPSLQIQILQELVGTSRRMGQNALCTRHQAFLGNSQKIWPNILHCTASARFAEERLWQEVAYYFCSFHSTLLTCTHSQSLFYCAKVKSRLPCYYKHFSHFHITLQVRILYPFSPPLSYTKWLHCMWSKIIPLAFSAKILITLISILIVFARVMMIRLMKSGIRVMKMNNRCLWKVKKDIFYCMKFIISMR